MQRIAVIFGGRTVEHDISIITGLGVIKNISAKYDVVPIYITRKGEWLTGDNLLKKESFVPNTEDASLGDFEPRSKICYIENNEPYLVYHKGLGRTRIHIDCAVLALHGGDYEGGAIQGILTLANIPYTSANVLSSSVCMDKVVTKLLLKGLGIATSRYVWGEGAKDVLQKLKRAHLKFPLIVKPARAGSSIGIKKVDKRDNLQSAIEYALKFDTKVLVEECFTQFREFSVAAFRLNDEIKCSSIEEDLVNSDIFDFNEKYCSREITRQIPAEVDDFKDQIYEITRLVYREFGLSGVVRVDYLLANDKLYLNEINTIPGSLAFYLWREQGISFSRLIGLNIEAAIREFNKKQQITYTYASNALAALSTVDKIIEK